MLMEVVNDADAELRSLERHHREREDARAAMQADLLSFDESREGESLRRHQIRTTRAIVRIAERFRKARRKGVALAPDLPAPAAGPAVTSESGTVGEKPADQPAASGRLHPPRRQRRHRPPCEWCGSRGPPSLRAI